MSEEEFHEMIDSEEADFLVPDVFDGMKRKYLIYFINRYPDELYAMRMVGIDLSTLKTWKAEDEEFFNFLVSLQELFANKLMSKYLSASDDGNLTALYNNLKALRPQLYDRKALNETEKEEDKGDQALAQMVKAIRESKSDESGTPVDEVDMDSEGGLVE